MVGCGGDECPSVVARSVEAANRPAPDGRGFASTLHVVEQNALVVRLERNGWDTANARRLLKLLEESRTLYLAERDRLRRELDSTAPIEALKSESAPPAPEDKNPPQGGLPVPGGETRAP